jgi:hypothetical protein
MTQLVAHRGPDGEALVMRGSVGLGHQRLGFVLLGLRESVWVTALPEADPGTFGRAFPRADARPRPLRPDPRNHRTVPRV